MWKRLLHTLGLGGLDVLDTKVPRYPWRYSCRYLYAYFRKLVELEYIILLMQLLQNYLLFYLQLLVFKLAFQFLRFCNFPHCLVEVVLVYRVPVIFDSEESPTVID